MPFPLFWLKPLCRLLACVVLAGGGAVRAAEFRPTVGPGATKDEVIAAYGWPAGQSQAGSKEILTYPQGKITLENGRVDRVEFSLNVPWPAPRPRPAAPKSSTAKGATTGEAPLDFWVTSFEEAAREARRRNARILALFTGSDWSPASRQFQEQIEFHPDFVNAVTGDFVLLRLDFPTRTQQAESLRLQNAELRNRYHVTTYPSLIVLSPAGAPVGHIDLTKLQTGDTYRAQVIAAIREVKTLLLAHPPAPDPGDVPAAPAPATPVEEKTGAKRIEALKHSLDSANWLLLAGIGGGLLLAGLMWWMLWRPRRVEAGKPTLSMNTRIGDAAAGLPSAAELRQWPVERVRALAAGLAEVDNYAIATRAGGSDPDLALSRRGEPTPRVLVCCAAAKGGPLSAKRMRELVGALAVENVPVGWYVAPGGFSAEARAYGEQNKILLLDAEALQTMLRDLPPLLLPKVIARTSVAMAPKPPA